MITILTVNYLDWEHIITGDPDEPDHEFYHPCLAWCATNDISYQQLVEILPHSECIDDWDKLDRPVDIKLAFDNPADATMFRLRWADA